MPDLEIEKPKRIVPSKKSEIIKLDSDEKKQSKKKAVKKEPVVKEEKKIYSTYEDYPIEDLLLYAGVDTYATSRVFAKMMPKLVDRPTYLVQTNTGSKVSTKAKAILDVYEESSREIFDLIADLECEGIHYDQTENRRLDVSMKQEVKELEESIFTSIGKRINLDSSIDVPNLLYNELGFTPPYETKGGLDAADNGAILILAGLDPMSPGKYISPNPEHQFLANMAKRKNLVAVHRGFIETYIDDYVKRDGRVHAKYLQGGTSTFRLSSQEPNLQNIPRAFGVKACFGVEDGNIFLAADYSSAEIKLLSAICADENMLRAVREGLDFHSYAAANMYGIPYQEFISVIEDKSNPLFKQYKQYRQNSKALGFGILYGSSAGGIAKNLNISIEDANRLINMYFTSFPKLKEYIEKTHFAAIANQFVTTPFGHRRNFYGTQQVFKKTAAYNAALRGSQNYVIQSSTAIIGLLSFAMINKEIKKLGGKCIATVHDSLEAEIPQEKAAEAAEVFFYYMNDWPQQTFDWLGLCIGSETEVGLNWQSTEIIHRNVTQEAINNIMFKLKA